MSKKLLLAGISIPTLAIAAYLALAPDRADILEQWNPNYRNYCTSFGAKAEFGDKNDVYKSASKIRDYLSKSQVGSKIVDHMEKTDMALCFGEPMSQLSDVVVHGRTNAYIINFNSSDEKAALEILKPKLGKNAQKLAKYSSKLKPSDALLWSRAVSAHKDVAELHQLFQTSDQNIQSRFWEVVRKDENYGSMAHDFEMGLKQNVGAESAFFDTFRTAVKKHADNGNHARHFMKWYQGELKDRTELDATPCMDFDGNMSVCFSSKTVPPPKGTAQFDLKPGDLTQLNKRLFLKNGESVDYISQDKAHTLLADNDNRKVNKDIVSSYAGAKKRAKQLGKGVKARGSLFGISMGGKIGINF